VVDKVYKRISRDGIEYVTSDTFPRISAYHWKMATWSSFHAVMIALVEEGIIDPLPTKGKAKTEAKKQACREFDKYRKSMLRLWSGNHYLGIEHPTVRFAMKIAELTNRTLKDVLTKNVVFELYLDIIKKRMPAVDAVYPRVSQSFDIEELWKYKPGFFEALREDGIEVSVSKTAGQAMKRGPVVVVESHSTRKDKTSKWDYYGPAREWYAENESVLSDPSMSLDRGKPVRPLVNPLTNKVNLEDSWFIWEPQGWMELGPDMELVGYSEDVGADDEENIDSFAIYMDSDEIDEDMASIMLKSMVDVSDEE